MGIEEEQNKEAPKHSLSSPIASLGDGNSSGLSPDQKKQARESEQKDKIQADLMFFNQTREERQKIYDEMGIDERGDIDSIEYAFESLIKTGRIMTGLEMDETKNALIQDVIDRISVEVFGNGHWPVPYVQEYYEHYEFDGVSKFEVITHPLYGLLNGEQWNQERWDNVNGDLDMYLEGEIVDTAKLVIAELKKHPSSIPSAYVYLMEIIQELDAMRTPPEPGTLRIYNMPRRSFLPEDKRNAMDQMLNKFSAPNVVVIDSYDAGTGRLNYKDIEFFRDKLPVSANVELQGGYIGGCLNATHFSFQKGVREVRGDINVTVDFGPSTSFAAPVLLDVRGATAGEGYPFRDMPPISIPAIEIRTIDDVRNWVNSNSQFLDSWMSICEPITRKDMEDGLKNITTPF